MAGTAIAIMNVVMPGVVKQHFPSQVGLFTSVYVSGLVLGAAVASGLTVPLEHATGYGWREVTAMAAIPAVAAAVLWLPQALRPRAGRERAQAVPRAAARPDDLGRHRLHGPSVADLLHHAGLDTHDLP